MALAASRVNVHGNPVQETGRLATRRSSEGGGNLLFLTVDSLATPSLNQMPARTHACRVIRERETGHARAALEQIKALPKGAGHLFAKTRRFPPEDPRSTFDAWQVGVYSDDPETYSVHAVVQEPGYYSGITFEIKAGTANGTYPLGPSGIAVRYYVDAGEGIEFYYAIRGEIKLTTNFATATFEASEFRFVAESEGLGKQVEVYLGNFKISAFG